MAGAHQCASVGRYAQQLECQLGQWSYLQLELYRLQFELHPELRSYLQPELYRLKFALQLRQLECQIGPRRLLPELLLWQLAYQLG